MLTCACSSRVTSSPFSSVFAFLAAVAVLVPSVPAAADPQSRAEKMGHVTLQAFADRQAVLPGQTLKIVTSLKTDKGWYIYWQNPGGFGLPTKLAWTVPNGYRVGRVRFPVPERKIDKTLGTTSYILEGTTLLVTPVHVPEAAAPGRDVTLTVKASWLVCSKASCVPGKVEVSLTLPVAAKGTEPKPANEKLLAQARRALPAPVKEAKYLKLSPALDKKAVKPGETFTVTLTAEIEAGHHMQSNKPLQEFLIPAIVFVEQTPGFEIGEVAYPKPHVRQDKVLREKMSEYSGKIAFKIPVEVEEDAAVSSPWIRGVLQSQICNDAGTCFRPQFVEFAVRVPVRGGGRPAEAKADTAPPPAAGTGDEGPRAASPTGGAEPAGGAQPDDAETADAVAAAEGVNRSIRAPTAEAVGHPADAAAQADATAEADDEAAPAATGGALDILVRMQQQLMDLGLVGVLIAGFIGGFLLNLMPCVLPVISLKVLSFVRQAHEDRWRVFHLGLTYSAGIMTFFMVLAVLFFRSGIGWGQLFQRPHVVIGMSAVVLAFAMSLFGVFALFTPRVVNKLGEKAEAREGFASAYGTGLLATLLGTACTAPFLSAAIAYAGNLSSMKGGLIFLSAGLGMAFPFIVLTYNPAWLRFVPRPGPWMGVFEHIMGFLLLATVIWLLNPIRGQLGDFGLLMSLIFLLAVAVAVWIKGKIRFGAPPAQKARLYATALVVLVVGWALPFRVMATIPELQDQRNHDEEMIALGLRAKYGRNLPWDEMRIPWQRYSRDLVHTDVEDGYTVFVDFTADWCASCKTNLKTSIDHDETIKVMRELGVMPYEADYTAYRPDITQVLEDFDLSGVPQYFVYKPGNPDKPEVLPQILTPGTLMDALKRAGPSQITRKAAQQPTEPSSEPI